MSDNLFLGDTTYPHLLDAEDHPVLVIDAAGNPVLETYGSVKAPANYSFECVNNFVHCEDPHYEELQYLALGMATRIAQLETELAEAKKDQARYKWLRNPDNHTSGSTVCVSDDIFTMYFLDDLDLTIDAAIASIQEKSSD